MYASEPRGSIICNYGYLSCLEEKTYMVLVMGSYTCTAYCTYTRTANLYRTVVCYLVPNSLVHAH